MPTIQKICAGCSTNVANKKRVKDTLGNYYCQPCYEARMAAVESATARVAAAAQTEPVPFAAAGVAEADPYDLAPAPARNTAPEIDLAEPAQLAPEPMAADMFGCADCKKVVNSRQIRNDDGDFVCAQCYASRRARRAPVKTQPRKSFAEEEGISDEPGFKDSILGGIVISAVIGIIGFGVHLGLLMAYPEKHFPTSLPLSIITAAMMTVLLVVQSGGLIGSMFITARILGGCDFGTLGSALWKSMAVVLALHVVNYFMPSIGFYTFGLRGLILVVTFMAVFRLDHFEAVLLAVINFFLFLGLAIAMGLAILSLSHTFRPHAYNNDDDAPAFHQPPDLKPLPADNNKAQPADNHAPADNNAQPAPAN